MLDLKNAGYRDVISRKKLVPEGDGLILKMPARSRVWLRPEKVSHGEKEKHGG